MLRMPRPIHLPDLMVGRLWIRQLAAQAAPGEPRAVPEIPDHTAPVVVAAAPEIHQTAAARGAPAVVVVRVSIGIRRMGPAVGAGAVVAFRVLRPPRAGPAGPGASMVAAVGGTASHHVAM